MKYPDVKFALNRGLDYWAAKEFRVGSSDYVDEFYKSHRKKLETFAKLSKSRWDKISPSFFRTTSKIFKNHPWPKGKYIGYISIFNCNPRFLKDKTFQVYFKHKAGSNFVTAHELLHFIFYDYAIRKHADLFRGKNTESGVFWDVAETFNSVILHLPEFVRILGVKKQIIYPEHKIYISRLNRLWKEKPEIDSFIIGAYKLMQGRNILRRR